MTRRAGNRQPSRAATLVIASVSFGLALASAGLAAAETTADRTIRDANRDNLLEFRAGEPHARREDLQRARGSARPTTILTFAQFTDTHIVDEESPLRVEFLDKFGPPLTSAYRPQEGLSPQVLNEMIRELREAVSPKTGRRAELVMTTGDNSDNSQLNEVRNVIDLMDGRVTVDPNSGLPGTCGTDDRKRYHGVRGGGEFYEPDASAGEDGPGYSRREAENFAEAQRSNKLRDFPGLYEVMNRPFWAIGLGRPWYGIFGNHDGLIQGNQPRNEALEAVAVGCVKVTALSPTALAALQALVGDGLAPDEFAEFNRIVQTDTDATIRDPSREGGTLAEIVPRDPRRRPLKKVEYIQEHFNTRGTPRGHGFTLENLASGMGNFSFSPKAGVRFIVLDSVNEGGGAEGNIDDGQFRWLHRQLVAAESAREFVMVFAHHSLRTMSQPPVSGFPPGDLGGNPSPVVHFGLGPGSTTAPCQITDPATPPSVDETLRCLFLRHRSVIAFISGHEHLNRIVPYARDTTAGKADGGFWEVTTASHIDWPQQSRLLDIVNNRNGTLSVFATIIDHGGVVRPRAVPRAPIDKHDLALMAGISRELSFNDPDAENGEEGHSDARGTRLDRNVELLVKHPYAF